VLFGELLRMACVGKEGPVMLRLYDIRIVSYVFCIFFEQGMRKPWAGNRSVEGTESIFPVGSSLMSRPKG